MNWSLFAFSFIATMCFYIVGDFDGEKKEIKGLIIWGILHGIWFVWLLATAVALRGN